MAATFDTLKYAEKLEEGGFTHAQARAAALAFADATSEQLASKSDLAAVRSDIRELELRMTVKFGTMSFAATGIILGAIFTLAKALGH